MASSGFVFNSLAEESTAAIQTSLAQSSDTKTDSPCDDVLPINHIGDIDIRIHPVFDANNPDENNFLFRAVNWLHIDTRASTVKNDLLIKPGDSYDEKLIQESERRLRTRPYLNNASIKTTNHCTDNKNLTQKNVQVDVREVWTLLPEFTFSHAGSSSHSGYGLHDSNFLGFGKTINLSHSSDTERTGDIIEYVDPNTNFYKSRFSYYYANNSDGIHKHSELIKPFESVLSDWSASADYEDYSEQNTLYNQGREVDRFAHINHNVTFFYGIKLPNSSRESANRLVLGYTQWEDYFSAVPDLINETPFVPTDRQFNYPWLEYQHLSDGFIQAYNIQQINRVEDINLGAQIRFRLGKVKSKYAANDGSWAFSGDYSQAFRLSENQMLLSQFSAKGFYGDLNLNDENFYNTRVSGQVSYHWQNFKRGQFYASATQARGFNLFGDLPLELGGDTGLRGYPIRYQAGDHSELFTIEQRYFGEREWLSLFHAGAVIFYDEGRAWGKGAIPQLQTQRLRDWGLGLRFSGTRTGNRDEGTHNVVHFDLAFPLDGDPSLKTVQWLVKVQQSF